MAEEAPDSYAAAIAQAQQLVRQGRLADPGEHFPYKHAEVSALVADNPPAGPDGPDDDRVRVEDYMTQEIADATRDYVDAQAAYLAEPGDATLPAYDTAREDLVAARQAHRANRVAPTVVGIRARRAGE